MKDELEIEKSVLGAMLMDNTARIQAMDILPVPDCFTDGKHKIIFTAICAMSSSGLDIDMILVAKYLKQAGSFETAGGAKYLAELISKISTVGHIELHARYLLEKYLRVEVNALLTDSLKKSISDRDDIFEVIEKTQKGIADILNNNLKSSEKSMEQWIREEREERYNPVEEKTGGISTGSKTLDSFTGGFVKSDLWIVGGRPGSGKTSWMVSCALDVAGRGYPVGIISIEMRGNQIVQRMISSQSGVEAIKLRNAKSLTEEDHKRLPDFESKISKLPIHIYDPASIRSQSVRTKAHIWKRKFDIKILFVDYLQKISGSQVNTRFSNRDQEMGEVSATLKTIAKELDIPVICLASLNRDVEKRSDKIPQLSDLRESGNIESDADEVLFFMRPEYYGLTGNFMVDKDQYPVDGLAVGSLAKNRHGSTGEIAFRFEKTIMKFSDYYPSADAALGPIFNQPEEDPGF